MSMMREELAPVPPPEVISEQQLGDLQSRLDGLHASSLLSDEDLCLLEDLLADYIQLRATVDVVTMETVHTNPVAGKLHALISLSEGLPKDSTLARQARRKLL